MEREQLEKLGAEQGWIRNITILAKWSLSVACGKQVELCGWGKVAETNPKLLPTAKMRVGEGELQTGKSTQTADGGLVDLELTQKETDQLGSLENTPERQCVAKSHRYKVSSPHV